MLKPNHPAVHRRHPTKLFLEVTTRCNLCCKMCVKQAPGNAILAGDLSASTFAALKPAVGTLDEVIIGGIGEPLLHPDLEDLILDMKAMLPAHGTVGLQTNGTLLTRDRIDALFSVDVDVICISVDAVDPDLLSAIRAGVHIDQLETVFARLTQARHRLGGAGPLVGVQFVIMQENLSHLPQVLRWADRMGVDFAIVSHLLPFDLALSAQVAYPSASDAATSLFLDWRQRISAKGLRMADYPAASMKYYKSRSADEHRLIDMVEAMKADAYGQGIPLDLAGLLTAPTEWVHQVDAIFQEAMAIAQASTMDLILPARQPEHARRCSFIEEGSAFMAWDGSISPCHFTWHPVACYPDGRRKVVTPIFFGNINTMPLIDIWNGQTFKSFRESVLRYDYPYCGDCSLSPCDLIEAAPFVHDCHTTSVPCCDCLWPTGILNCLQ